MSNIENLSKEDIVWLLNDYNRIRNYGKVSQWIDWHVKTLQMLKGSWAKPGCNCEWSAHSRIASNTYEQFEQQLKDRLAILESPVIDELSAVTKRSRGRSKKDTQE
jgi:hypothetical protein